MVPVPIQNLARYQAPSHGITIQVTLERLAAVCEVDVAGVEADNTWREAYLTIKQLQLRSGPAASRRGFWRSPHGRLFRREVGAPGMTTLCGVAVPT
jgi:signal-transduction protein with cAMP-binding, CBS, and nucleotidyltransferase domain